MLSGLLMQNMREISPENKISFFSTTKMYELSVKPYFFNIKLETSYSTPSEGLVKFLLRFDLGLWE